MPVGLVQPDSRWVPETNCFDWAPDQHALVYGTWPDGTEALYVAELDPTTGISPGDEVITQGFTFVATWETILDSGAVPVFAELDQTLCLDPADVAKKITSRRLTRLARARDNGVLTRVS